MIKHLIIRLTRSDNLPFYSCSVFYLLNRFMRENAWYFYVQIVHQANSDAPVDSAYQQATDVMVCLVAQTEVMKLAAVSYVS